MTACSESSTRDPMLPIDRDEVKSSVQFYLNGITTDDISDTYFDLIIENCISKFEDSAIYTCDVTYCSLLEVLRYLIRKSWVGEGDKTVGAIKRVREKEGEVEIEQEWHSVSGNIESGWEKLYEHFLQNPEDICECLKPSKSNSFGLISIGGTQQDKYIENVENPNSRTVWDTTSTGTKYSYKREQRRRQSLSRSKFWYK